MSNQFLGCYPLFIVAGGVQRLLIIYTTVLVVPLSMCSNIFFFVDLQTYSHGKKDYQGDSNSNRSPLDLYQVYYDIQNTNGFRRWNTRSSFSHENLDSFIVCVLP